MTLNNIKIQLASVVLAIVLTAAYIGNMQNLTHKSASRNSRFPASVGQVNMASSSLDKLQLIEEQDLADEVALKSPRRGLASVGQPADGMTNLRYGALEGKYAFKMDGEKISEISFIESSSEKPAIIPDRADFLKKYADQFGLKTVYKKLSSVLKDDRLIETYSAKTSTGQTRLVQMTLGEANTLLALKTQEAPTLKLF
jgi:hypothetical protein